MRQILSLSLPEQQSKEIKVLSKKRGFASVSGYIQHLVHLDKDIISELALLDSIKKARKEYKDGKTTTANSMADFL